MSLPTVQTLTVQFNARSDVGNNTMVIGPNITNDNPTFNPMNQDSDGVRDDGEPTPAGWTIYLDANNKGEIEGYLVSLSSFEPIPGDADLNNIVDAADDAILAAHWGATGTVRRARENGSGHDGVRPSTAIPP